MGITGSVSRIAVDPATPSTVYAGTNQYSGAAGATGVFKSTDGGASWAMANSGLVDLRILGLAIDVSSPSTLFVATASGVFKSADSAGSWSDLVSSQVVQNH